MQLPQNLENIPSPALLVYPEKIQANIAKMLGMVNGDSKRLRPHVKTHKTPQIIQMQVEAGITHFKCATLSEARMTAGAGAQDVLLAYQPVGPNVELFLKLQDEFPNVTFATVEDCMETIQAFEATGKPANLYLDVDCGMHRTGIAPGDKAIEICQALHNSSNLNFAGLHVYDGHIHEANLDERLAAHEKAMATWKPFQEQLLANGIPVENIVTGGSPTFPFYANDQWQCSPGTTLLWDAGYSDAHPDMDFEVATYLLCRVISKPGENQICLDLGYKAIASERPFETRFAFPTLSEVKPISHSEEHLVLQLPTVDHIEIGSPVLVIPWHICPTVALYDQMYIVENNTATGESWPITARTRLLS